MTARHTCSDCGRSVERIGSIGAALTCSDCMAQRSRFGLTGRQSLGEQFCRRQAGEVHSGLLACPRRSEGDDYIAMSSQDDFGDRMKAYEGLANPRLLPRVPVCARLDGRRTSYAREGDEDGEAEGNQASKVQVRGRGGQGTRIAAHARRNDPVRGYGRSGDRACARCTQAHPTCKDDCHLLPVLRRTISAAGE
jgi:hypothetical protein